jgi:plastocyanin
VAATLAVILSQTSGEPLGGAVVTARSLSSVLPVAAPLNAVMDQVDRAFTPESIVVPVGSTVSFPNSDTVSHQVYSFSPTKRFQLPLYRGKPYPPVHFDNAGIVVLGCNIHDSMVGYIVVTDAPLFGVTNAQGSWSAASLPAGDYEITIWHPRADEPARELKRRVQLGATDRSELRVQLARPLQPSRRNGKAGPWDY